MKPTLPTAPQPTPIVSLILFVVLAGAMVYLRLGIYRYEPVTLSYSLPLLLCIWYRDLRLLWAMAVAFACLTTYKAFLILPDFNPTHLHDLGQWVMQVANIVFSAAVVHLVIKLMNSLQARQCEFEQANCALAGRERELSNQNDMLQSQGEELAQRSQELREQANALQLQVKATSESNARLQERKSMLRAAEAALRSQNERLSLLSDALVVLLLGRDPQRTLRDFFPRVTQLLGVDTFLNYMVDKAGTGLVLQGSAGVPDEVASQIRHLQFGEPLFGSAARSRQAVLVSHMQDSTEPEYALLRSLGIQAFCCNPLENGTQLIGTLAFASRTRPEFTADDLEFIRLIARYVAVGIDRARTQEELKRRVASRTEELQRTIASLETAVSERRQAEEQLRERHEELNRRTSQLRALTMELTQAEERERRRLAQVLHDNLQPLILAARMQLKIFTQDKEKDPRLDAIHCADGILRDAAQESRALTMQLTPPVLHEFGLAEALVWLAEASQQHLLHVSVDIQAQSPPGHPTSILLFQCARELLLNVAKHAGVRTATLVLRQRAPNLLELEVSDAGTGFKDNPEGVVMGSGFGLFSIRERLDYLGGNMTIDSQPGRGTRIILQVPFRTEEEATTDRASIAPLLPVDHSFGEADEDSAAVGEPCPARPRLLLVDDHVLVRSGVAEVLRRDLSVDIVGAASNGLDAIRSARELRPDLILMDVNLPGISGIEATRIITRELTSVRVVRLSMDEDESVASAMLNACIEFEVMSGL